MSTSIWRDGLTWNEGLAERQLNGLVTDGIAGLNDGVMGESTYNGYINPYHKKTNRKYTGTYPFICMMVLRGNVTES